MELNSEKKEDSSSSTVIYIVVGVIGAIVVLVILGLFVKKKMGDRETIIWEDEHVAGQYAPNTTRSPAQVVQDPLSLSNPVTSKAKSQYESSKPTRPFPVNLQSVTSDTSSYYSEYDDSTNEDANRYQGHSQASSYYGYDEDSSIAMPILEEDQLNSLNDSMLEDSIYDVSVASNVLDYYSEKNKQDKSLSSCVYSPS